MALTQLEQLKLEKLKRARDIRQAGGVPQAQQTITESLSTSNPLQPSGDPIIDALLNVQKEFVGPLAQGANTAAFGIPKFLVRKIAGEDFAQQAFPEQSTTGGKFLRFGSEVTGLFQGGAAQLSQKAGAKLTPSVLGKIGLGLAKGEGAARRSAVLANKITRGAIEGAVFGATQLDVTGKGQPTIGGQLGQATAGATFGAAIPFIQTGVGRVARGIKKFRTPTKPSPVGALTRRAKGIKAEQAGSLQEQTRIALTELDDAIRNARTAKKTTFFTNKTEFNKKIQDTTIKLKSNVQALDDALQVQSEKTALEVQKKLPDFYRANSTAFGNRLDEISEAVATRGDDFTIAEIDDVLNKITADLDDALIIDGAPRTAIEALKNKYNLQFSQSTRGIISNAQERIPLKTLFNDIKSIRNTLSAGAKSGASRYTQEDVAVSVFNNHFAGLLEKNAPELIQLRQAYKPVIEAMKVSNRIFKPVKGQFDTKTGTQLLKRFALGNTEAGEEALLTALEQGSSFSPGIGKITPRLRAMGNELKLAKTRMQPIINDMRNANLIFNERVDRQFLEQLQDLASKKAFIEGNSLVKEKIIISALEKRLLEIGARKDVVASLTKDKAKALAVARNVIFLAGGAGAVIGLSRGLSR